MKVFLSWSGDRSKAVAQALNDVLPSMLHPISCWMSEGGIEKGRAWFDQLSGALNDILFGVFCLTAENQSEPWVLWEAGFLSSKMENGRLAPLCIDLPKAKLDGPFAIYQATDTSREEMLSLIEAMNNFLPAERRVPQAALRLTFQSLWPGLDKSITAASSIPSKVVAPHATLGDKLLEQILEVVRSTNREVAALQRNPFVGPTYLGYLGADAKKELIDKAAHNKALVAALAASEPKTTKISELAKLAGYTQIAPPPEATMQDLGFTNTLGDLLASQSKG